MRSRVLALRPVGCECRNVAMTACSISRNFSPTDSAWTCRAQANFGFQDARPASCLAVADDRFGHGDEFARRLRQPVLLGRTEKDRRPDQRRLVPCLGLPQGQGEGPQHAAGPLEPLDACGPFGVKDFGQFRVEREALEIAFLGHRAQFAVCSSSAAMPFRAAITCCGQLSR